MTIPQHPPSEDDPPAGFISPDLADIAGRLDCIDLRIEGTAARLDRIEAKLGHLGVALARIADAVQRVSGGREFVREAYEAAGRATRPP